MAPRDPSRAKASDWSDRDALEAARSFTEDQPDDRGVNPRDAPALGGHFLPAKVISSKMAKLLKRGLIDSRDRLTAAGRTELDRLEQEQTA